MEPFQTLNVRQGLNPDCKSLHNLQSTFQLLDSEGLSGLYGLYPLPSFSERSSSSVAVLLPRLCHSGIIQTETHVKELQRGKSTFIKLTEFLKPG
jgi:hypothetical protein